MVDVNFSMQYKGDGQFAVTVDGETTVMNMADMDLFLRMEQVEQWDQEIADQYSEIKEANLKRKQLNQLLTKMRKAKSEGKDDDDKSTWAGANSKKSEEFKLEGTDGENRSVDEWFTYFGLHDDMTDVQHNKSKKTRDAQWDTNIEVIKGQIDEISSDTELKMLRFRQLVDKRGTALQEAKSTMTADKQLKDNILR